MSTDVKGVTPSATEGARLMQAGRSNELTSRDAGAPRARALAEWEVAFARWEHQEPKRRRPIEEQQRIASAFANRPVTYRVLRRLRERPEYRELMAALQEGGIKLAKAQLARDLPKYVEAHSKGVDMALEAKDHRAIPSYTTPVLDRVAPKNERPVAAAQVTITLSPKQAAALDAGDVEVLPTAVARRSTPTACIASRVDAAYFASWRSLNNVSGVPERTGVRQ